MTMPNLKIDLTPPSTSSDDTARAELLWESREEDHVLRLQKIAAKKAELHSKKAATLRTRYKALGVPAAILPLIASTLHESKVGPPLVITIFLLLSAVLSGVTTFLNLGGRAERHDSYAAKYDQVVLDSQTELSKPKRARVACDVYLERLRLTLGHLNDSAPPL
jgi:hypothetical protein